MVLLAHLYALRLLSNSDRYLSPSPLIVPKMLSPTVASKVINQSVLAYSGG